MKSKLLLLISAFLSFAYCLYGQNDMRNITSGVIIPDESYSDQPYIVKTDDGAWLCVITTGGGHEGASGQHIITQRSLDKGKTWVDWANVEPADGPEASYAVLLKAPSGRIFVFYNHNSDNTRWVIGDNPPYADGKVTRVDSQGYFVFKYSDDHGKTWSAERITIPVRNFEIDLKNPYQGKIQFFWNVGKAFNYQGKACVPIIKVGGFGDGFFTSNEGALLQSPNLFTEKDPVKATWITLPEGNTGLKTPKGGGPIAAEQSFSILSDGSLFCVYRTIDGHAAYTYSRNGGRNWDEPQYMKYGNGNLMKHPRAANFAWKCENGKFLYWFHNHGGRFIKEHPNRRGIAYNDRNPVWISGGVEADSPEGKIIKWSQPEILLYDDDPFVRMSYPDLIEEDGKYYISETQKDIARVHEIDKNLLSGLWNQFENNNQTTSGLILNWFNHNDKLPYSIDNPLLPDLRKRDNNALDGSSLSTRAGFTIEINFKLESLSEGQILLDSRTDEGKGWNVRINEKGALEVTLNDGQTQALWSGDKVLKPGTEHYASIVIDGGPGIISFIIDGVLNDGGSERQFGWGRISPHLKSVEGAKELVIGKRINGTIGQVKIYNRAIRTSEAIGNFRYAQEWKRTNPDIVVYRPTSKEDGDNEHFLVFEAPKSNELLAMWTQSSVEGHGDNRAVIARSNNGVNWSPPQVIAGKSKDSQNGQASWAFPVVTSKGRIYCFFTKETNPDTRQHSGIMGCYYSDDNGHNWIEGKDIQVPRNKYDNPDTKYSVNWIVWQKPIRDKKGRYISGYTQWTSEAVVKKPTSNWTDQDSRSYFIRFENIDENPDDVIITWLPANREGLAVPHRKYPEISVAQEPAITLLPDGRLFCVMRTMTGYIWYSVSDDDGETWREPEVLKYNDNGEKVPNPMASSPIYKLSNGKYMLVFYNNDGKLGNYDQFKEKWESNQADFLRNPAFISIGEFKPKARQPIWFSPPTKLFDTNNIPVGPKGTAEVATYPSVTEKNGIRILWYPDRKHFLLGKYLNDE